MREIKFRVWAEDRFVFIGLFSTDHGYHVASDMGLDRDYPIMQYTGLKDRNGKEIYEGDILRPLPGKLSNFKSGGIVFQVSYVEDQGAFLLQFPNEEDNAPDYYDLDMCFLCEVIGNIYENPELLEK